MNLRYPRSAVAILVLAVVVGAFWWLRPSPEQQMRRQMNRLIDVVAKAGPESALQAAAAAHRLPGYFAESFELHPGSPFEPIRGGADLSSQFLRVRSLVDRLDIQTDLGGILLTPDRAGATMGMQARVTAIRQGERYTDEREFEVEWIREDGDWKIRRVAMTSSVQSPWNL